MSNSVISILAQRVNKIKAIKFLIIGLKLIALYLQLNYKFVIISVVKKWKLSLKKHTESNTKASPIVLVVSSGGQRAADLLRFILMLFSVM